MKRLIKEIIEKPEEYETEAKLLLVLELNNRPGEAFTDYDEYSILEGEVEEVEIDRRYNYPTENVRVVALIPKKMPTVIRFYHFDTYQRRDNEEITYYIFTYDGWKSVRAK